MSESETISLRKDDILYLAGDNKNDLFIIEKGEVMVFVQKGSEITPIAYLSTGEYIGELSFLDGHPRSASIICTKDTTFTRVPSEEVNKQFPSWLRTIALQLTKKIRAGDELIRSKGIRKKNLETIKPLPIAEQTRCFKLVELFKDNQK